MDSNSTGVVRSGNLAGMKICRRCKLEKDLSNFAKKGTGTQPYCKECQNEYTQAHYKKNRDVYLKKAEVHRDAAVAERRELIQQLKSVPCADCGVQYPPYVMDFDHLRDKEFNISEKICGFGVNIKRLQDEVAKCDVVCSNCHRIRTHARLV